MKSLGVRPSYIDSDQNNKTFLSYPILTNNLLVWHMLSQLLAYTGLSRCVALVNLPHVFQASGYLVPYEYQYHTRPNAFSICPWVMLRNRTVVDT